MLFDKQGTRQFAGGVTESRGHEGDNAGLDALQRILCNESNVTGVFRSWLVGSVCPNQNKSRMPPSVSEQLKPSMLDRGGDYRQNPTSQLGRLATAARYIPNLSVSPPCPRRRFQILDFATAECARRILVPTWNCSRRRCRPRLPRRSATMRSRSTSASTTFCFADAASMAGLHRGRVVHFPANLDRCGESRQRAPVVRSFDWRPACAVCPFGSPESGLGSYVRE